MWGSDIMPPATLDQLDTLAQNSDAAPERISVPVMVMSSYLLEIV